MDRLMAAQEAREETQEKLRRAHEEKARCGLFLGLDDLDWAG